MAEMEDKRHPAHGSREHPDQFSEDSRSLDSFLVAKPPVSEPAAPVSASSEPVDKNDFDD